MKHVIMVSYDEFAPGLHSTVKMMTGGHNDALNTSLKAGMSAGEFAADFRTSVEPLSADNSVILPADILGGSPFTNILAVLDGKGLMSNTLVSAGVNVSLATTAVLMKDNFGDVKLLKETLLSEGHAGLTEFKAESDDAEDDT